MAKGKRDGLYRRRNGVFAFRFKDQAGQWREKYTSCTDRHAAKAYKVKFEQDVEDNNLPLEMASWRLDQAERWWNEFRAPRIAKTTNDSDRYRLQHFGRILGNKRLVEITNQDIDMYVTKRLKEGIGRWSINKEVRLWAMILRKAKLWRKLKEDYKPEKTQASDIGQAISRAQLCHLAEIAGSNVLWESAFYGSVLAANAGLRGGEIKRGLRIATLDLEHRQLRIKRADAKTDASARFIELNADATEAAARLLMRYQLICAQQGIETSDDHYLLPFNASRVNHGAGKGGRGYDPTRPQAYWDTAWASLTEAAGLPGFRFHDLRHTFITHMVERGVSIGTIQTFVGHISNRMLRHYTHISSGVARRAVEMLDDEPMLPQFEVKLTERTRPQ